MKSMEIEDHRDWEWLKETMKAMMKIICLNINIARSNEFFHILPKLWPRRISKHQFHGLIEFKMAHSQIIVPNLENLKLRKAIRNT
jgi:hypothetical protein